MPPVVPYRASRFPTNPEYCKSHAINHCAVDLPGSFWATLFKAAFTLLLRLLLINELRRREPLLFAVGFDDVLFKELCSSAMACSVIGFSHWVAPVISL